jgi:hypothetical protein
MIYMQVDSVRWKFRGAVVCSEVQRAQQLFFGGCLVVDQVTALRMMIIMGQA